jgi:uncharacterized protein
MISVILRFYAELNDELAVARGRGAFAYSVEPSTTVGMLAQQLGIHSDNVDLVLVNGESVDFTRALSNGDYVSMYPVFESFDIADVTRVRKTPLRKPKFVLDVHLGKLASHLRMCGFDAAFSTNADDAALVAQARDENRTLLSKDRRLLQHPQLTRKHLVQGSDPRVQVKEVFERFDLYGAILPFTRCIECNTPLCRVEKGAVRHRLPPKVELTFEEFQICNVCDRVYWKGSHYTRMKMFVDDLLAGQPKGVNA